MSSRSPDPGLPVDDDRDDDFDFDLDLDGILALVQDGEAGGAPPMDLDFLLVPLLDEAEQQMRSIRRPLDAEMWASELLGMLELSAPEGHTPEDHRAVTLALATRLVEHALELNTASGLAILRTLSVIGPEESRGPARAAATQLAGGGLKDRAWAASVGRPEVGRTWRFSDPDGTQESLTVVFSYAEHQHTLTVLIDHELGGGVKDAWIGEDPDAVLAETVAALEPDGIEVEFVSVESVAETLRTALTRPECPAGPDEIEDVAMCRALLHARVELLTSHQPPVMPRPPMSRPLREGTLEG